MKNTVKLANCSKGSKIKKKSADGKWQSASMQLEIDQ